MGSPWVPGVPRRRTGSGIRFTSCRNHHRQRSRTSSRIWRARHGDGGARRRTVGTGGPTLDLERMKDTMQRRGPADQAAGARNDEVLGGGVPRLRRSGRRRHRFDGRSKYRQIVRHSPGARGRLRGGQRPGQGSGRVHRSCLPLGGTQCRRILRVHRHRAGHRFADGPGHRGVRPNRPDRQHHRRRPLPAVV